MTTVEIHGVYECGHSYKRRVAVRDQGDLEITDDWWQEAVWPEIGDGHEEDEGNCTTAVVVEAPDPRVIGNEWEWVTG